MGWLKDAATMYTETYYCFWYIADADETLSAASVMALTIRLIRLARVTTALDTSPDKTYIGMGESFEYAHFSPYRVLHRASGFSSPWHPFDMIQS